MSWDRVFIGVVVTILCGVGLRNARWFLTETKKGQRLTHWFGENRAMWILRGLFLTGAAFGVLLAAGVVRPIQW